MDLAEEVIPQETNFDRVLPALPAVGEAMALEGSSGDDFTYPSLRRWH